MLRLKKLAQLTGSAIRLAIGIGGAVSLFFTLKEKLQGPPSAPRKAKKKPKTGKKI